MFHCNLQGINAYSTYVKEHTPLLQTTDILIYWKAFEGNLDCELDAQLKSYWNSTGLEYLTTVVSSSNPNHWIIVTGEMESLSLKTIPSSC